MFKFVLKSLLAIAAICFAFPSTAQIKAKPALQDSVLFTKKIKGNVLQVHTWNDKLGTNHLVLTEGNFRWVESDSTEGREKELYAYHFLNGDSLLWKLFDFKNDCIVDLTVEFRDKATTITDLDKNGVAESWIMYSLACRGDVSGSTLKMIMHQGASKHIVRGTAHYSRTAKDPEYGGRFVPDVSFAKLPKLFKDFARKLWQQHLYDDEAVRE